MKMIRILSLSGITVIILSLLSACQTSNVPNEESSDFYGAIIRYDGRSFNMNVENSYLLLYEILNAQEVAESENITENQIFQINLFSNDSEETYGQLNYDVFMDEQKYHVVDQEKKITYVLHSYYAPTLNEIVKIVNEAVRD
ncbi:MAG: hypothetical protein CVV02_16270 [Firmicutes bacterium HGW-Firmicutes-7]|nr:MAG: hypothetical protein CVV02_16270 [Firmicutes bacterium HGW-Firmicutes-7]